MSNYQKENYFNQWQNWKHMCELGFHVPSPPFVISENKGSAPIQQKASRVKNLQCLGDTEEWIPEGQKQSYKPKVYWNKISCENCKTKFNSKRILMKHQRGCLSPAQGIGGRHLQSLTDQDLMHMGVTKGPRMDILAVAKKVSESNKENSSLASEIDRCKSWEYQPYEDSHPWQALCEDMVGSANDNASDNEDSLSSVTTLHTHTQTPQSPVSCDFSVPARILSSSSNMETQQTLSPIDVMATATASSSKSCTMTLSSSAERFPNLHTHPHSHRSQVSRDVSVPARILSSSSNMETQQTLSPIDVMATATASSSKSCTVTLSSSAERFPSLHTHPHSHRSQVSRDVSVPARILSSSSNMVTQQTFSSSSDPMANTASSSRSCSVLPSAASLNSEARVDNLVREATKNLKFGFNITSILDSSRGGVLIKDQLERTGFVDPQMSKSLSRILIAHINNNLGENSPVAMKEEMAKTLVLNYPKMRKTLCVPSDMPWHHLYNSSTNTGILQNVYQGTQRLKRKETGQGERQSKKPRGMPRQLVITPVNRSNPEDPDPDDFIRNVTEAKNSLPNVGEKRNILTLMAKTHQRRRHLLVHKGVLTSELITVYPHFLSYQGEVIMQEFNLSYPKSASGQFLRSFSIDYVPKLLKVARENPGKYPNANYYGDDVLNALLVLSKFLPTPKRTFSHEEKQPLHAQTADFFHMIPVGSDPKHEANRRRDNAGYSIQPHVMAIGHPKAIGKMFLVLGDSELLELSRSSSPTNAVDLLIKTYFALNLHFPLGWKNVFRFLQIHLYGIPLENPRESKFDDKNIYLRNLSF